MNPVPREVNTVELLDNDVAPRTLPYFEGISWEVSVAASGIAVMKGRPRKSLDSRVTDSVDYYMWCCSNIWIHRPPENRRAH